MSVMREYPRKTDGSLDLARLAAELSLNLHGIGTALTDCATRLAYIRELLPQRGELTDEFRELVTTLAWIETAYRNADEHLMSVAMHIEHEERCRTEGWTPVPLEIPDEPAP